jgi:hypothetical protein
MSTKRHDSGKDTISLFKDATSYKASNKYVASLKSCLKYRCWMGHALHHVLIKDA